MCDELPSGRISLACLVSTLMIRNKINECGVLWSSYGNVMFTILLFVNLPEGHFLPFVILFYGKRKFLLKSIHYNVSLILKSKIYCSLYFIKVNFASSRD